jgi:hypothetical protein
VYNAGIAGGSLAGGVVLEGAGAGALPWTALPLMGLALTAVAVGRRHAFPPARLPYVRSGALAGPPYAGVEDRSEDEESRRSC